MSQPNLLDPMTFPLNGARLIEASAGTGKTFTIAALYLRLLLGHGKKGHAKDGNGNLDHSEAGVYNDSAPIRPLTVDEILVVTFTEAATAELRGRIRQRIHEARIAFARRSSDDPFLKQLLDDVSDHQSAAQIMLAAERQMDEAAVYTIHGFCQRMLTQHAFESGSRFSNEFVTDEAKLKNQAVTDYWRSEFYQLPLNLAKEVRALWATPKDLLSEIQNYLSGDELNLTVTPMHSLESLYQSQLDAITKLKKQWLSASSEYKALIENSGINKRRFTKKSLPTWLDSITHWANSETTDTSIPEKLGNFSQAYLESDTKTGEVPTHTTFSTIEKFVESNQGIKGPMLAHAIQECRAKLAQAKKQQQLLSFDDLLTQLSAAIDSERGELLKQKIAEQYPIAMIDEFQDTDPLQYHIFSETYLNAEGTGLFMIGDPKQAIYGFRGADIFTYIHARSQVISHFTLGTNWRSSQDMVQASNQLFESADSPFLYDEDIPFVAVAASPSADKKVWTLNGEVQSALTYWVQEAEEKPCSKESYYGTMSEATASQIQQVLESSQKGEAVFINGEKQQNINPSDIAVLVRTGNEAKRVKAALSRQGISSVYLSNRDSVFASSMATEIKRLLVAVHTPEERSIRASLASSLFGLSVSELDNLNHDENLWESVTNEYLEYRNIWVKKGVQSMLWQVMRQRQLAQLLLGNEEGERLLTDFNHLAELLQQTSNEIESPLALIRWLADNIQSVEQGLGGGENSIQRLESEQNLVQIITIHKSKGLEYDLVFLPFVCSFREADEGKYYDENLKTTVLDINKNEASLKQADKERLAEELRLIYVAITRAVYGCFIGLSPIRNGRSPKEPTGVHRSAIGHLLQNGEAGGIVELNSAVTRHAVSTFVQHAEIPELPAHSYVPTQLSKPELSALPFSGRIESDWRVTSYSGLVKQGSAHHGAWDASLEWPEFDVDSAEEENSLDLVEASKTMFTFPRGANPGTFLHTLFETVEFQYSEHQQANRETVLRLLQQEQYDEEWLPVLMEMIEDTLRKPLDGENLRLENVLDNSKHVEMEFLLPIETLSASILHKLGAKKDELTSAADSLEFKTAKGMLKGFIDLVFEYQGKFYVLDWKSNHLGDSKTDYGFNKLQSAMVDHRYDVQYQLYTVALHRYLKTRIPNYSYETHFGGVYYLYLRGIEADSNNGIFFTKPDAEFVEALDAHISGELS